MIHYIQGFHLHLSRYANSIKMIEWTSLCWTESEIKAETVEQ